MIEGIKCLCCNGKVKRCDYDILADNTSTKEITYWLIGECEKCNKRYEWEETFRLIEIKNLKERGNTNES